MVVIDTDGVRSLLIEAQMHMECINEAFCEMWLGKKPSKKRQLVIDGELSARVWAAIYLTQAALEPNHHRPSDFDDVVREANAYNGELDGPIDVTGMN